MGKIEVYSCDRCKKHIQPVMEEPKEFQFTIEDDEPKGNFGVLCIPCKEYLKVLRTKLFNEFFKETTQFIEPIPEVGGKP